MEQTPMKQTPTGNKRTGIARIFSCLLLTALSAAAPLHAHDTVRAGVLKFGTVNWELDVVRHHGLDLKHGLSLEIQPFSSNQAALIAFQGGQADVIVSDWVKVARERRQGKDFSFIPYSTALGAVVVPPGSNARSLNDLQGLRVGVAGGAHDKSWLLLQAWASKHHGFDLADKLDVRYAAPPLLNGQIEHGKLDAVLNFWHYCARLEALGYRRLVEMHDVTAEFTGDKAVPMIGYIFRESWARGGIISRFNAAVAEARALLLKDDAEWQRLRPLMRVKSDADFNALRHHFRAGIPRHWGNAERDSAAKLFRVLAGVAGKNLTGGHSELAPGTFWEKVRF